MVPPAPPLVPLVRQLVPLVRQLVPLVRQLVPLVRQLVPLARPLVPLARPLVPPGGRLARRAVQPVVVRVAQGAVPLVAQVPAMVQQAVSRE